MFCCRFPFFAALLLGLLSKFADGQKSFAEMQFDLPPDLPAEEPPPVAAANQDASPSTVNVPQTAPPSPPTQPPPPPPPPSPSTAQTAPPTLVSLVPSTSLSTQFSSAFTTFNATTANPKTPLPMLPNLVELPRFVQNGNVQPITVPTALIEPGAANQSRALPSTQTTAQNPIPIATLPPPIKAPLAKLPPLRQISTGEQQVWFRDDFDIKDCPRNAEAIGKYFRKKFPKNLLRHQKETVLAELLAIRLRECLRKQREDHWVRLDKQLEKDREGGESKESEREECRGALVQEQIACMNLQSFSCQFIQPAFLFRLIPARLIVQEARLAEDGAERCRKFTLIGSNRKLSASRKS